MGSAVGVGDSRFRGRRVVRKALGEVAQWVKGLAASPDNPLGEGKEPTLASCPLAFTSILWHT